LSGGGGVFSAARRLAASISATWSRWCARFSVCSRAISAMVYIAATPEGGTNAFVGDTEELAEGRWVSPAGADKLTGNQIYEPVRIHLRRVTR
jgi:hypothetical protein